jgi:hypothetical protein
MNEDTYRTALKRLHDAPWRAKQTDKAIELLSQIDSEAPLRQALQCPDEASVALEALCALQSNSHHTYQAVFDVIQNNPRMCWCLVDSLNRLPWYTGMRAFLDLPGQPHTCPCALPFYILVRNKVFLPTDMSGPTYAYYVKGLWILLETAKSQRWQHLHPAGLAVIQLLHTHLKRSTPELFITYLSALLLGHSAPLRTSKQALLLRKQQHCHTLICRTAELTLANLPCSQSGTAVLRA